MTGADSFPKAPGLGFAFGAAVRGWRAEALYPLSIPFHGYSLNITVNGYAGTLNFGFIGCRDALPHLQRLAVYSGEALEELEATLPSS